MRAYIGHTWGHTWGIHTRIHGHIWGHTWGMHARIHGHVWEQPYRESREEGNNKESLPFPSNPCSFPSAPFPIRREGSGGYSLPFPSLFRSVIKLRDSLEYNYNNLLLYLFLNYIESRLFIDYIYITRNYNYY